MTGMAVVKQLFSTVWVATSSFFSVATCFLSELNSARVGPACCPPTAVVTYKSAAPARAATSSANPFILPPRSRDDDPTRATLALWADYGKGTRPSVPDFDVAVERVALNRRLAEGLDQMDELLGRSAMRRSCGRDDVLLDHHGAHVVRAEPERDLADLHPLRDPGRLDV